MYNSLGNLLSSVHYFKRIISKALRKSYSYDDCLHLLLTNLCILFFSKGRALDEILPFFSGDREETESQNNFIENNNSKFQEAALGVPTHYQNDGSFLYLLTPVFSPPSADSVYGWLSCVDKGIG